MAGRAEAGPFPHVVISGCSGGGKSTLIEALRRRGETVITEPGRRIVAAALADGEEAVLPWVDMAAFARRAIALSLEDIASVAGTPGRVFFDRGLIDAAAALEQATGEPALAALGRRHRFHRKVFLAPPWPEIHVEDGERRHGFTAAVAEYERLRAVYPMLGYEIVPLPKAPVEARVAFVLDALEADG